MTIPIYLRCYVDSGKKPDFVPKIEPRPNNSIVLVFDTETTSDQYQNLLFGTCGKWVNGKLSYMYLFYADDLPKQKLDIIKLYGKKHNYIVLSRKDFVERIFYPNVYRSRAKCVGFNLPFDLSRLTIHFGKSRKMHNGFTLKLSESPSLPNIVIKSISSKASFIEFTTPVRKESEKNQRPYKGCFVDLKTVTFALTNRSYTLRNALIDFECKTQKQDTETHGIITEKYLDYNVTDTISTHELYEACLYRYSLYGLSKDISKLYSPASIGKAILEKIGVESFLKKNLEFPKEILGHVMCCYYGGRTEDLIRKLPTKVTYLDFTSMYPSIYCLLGMDKFLKAKKIECKNTTANTQKFLDELTIQDIARKDTWNNAITICKIVPEDDILPVRSKFATKNTTNIGTNYLKSIDNTALWYSLPDLMASKLRSGKTPKIIDAISFEPKGIQDNLKEIEVLKGIPVKPQDDFIQTLIEQRIKIKQDKSKQAQIKQQILKIIANSTAYGIYIETNPNPQRQKTDLEIYGLDYFEMQSDKTEDAGRFFHPIMSIFLTACSRMILGTAQTLVEQNGGYVAYCDTDSLFVSPEHVGMVQKFFKPLNPYSTDVEMFKIEDDDNDKSLHDVWFYGISAKRYVLYEYDRKEIIIRKHSAHGLGHLIGIDEKQWWHDILSKYYDMRWNKSKYSSKFAVSQLTINNYDFYKRFEKQNRNRPLSKMIKPFNFITVGTGYRKDNGEPIIPMMPYVDKKKISEAPYKKFIDYKTGKSYPNSDSLDTSDYWKPMSEVFSDYVEHNDAKFDGEIGQLRLKRLEIDKSSVHYIGNESNEMERSEVLGAFPEDTIQYDDYQKRLWETVEKMTMKEALESGISKRTFYYLKRKVREGIPIKLKLKMLPKLLSMYS